jgi:uncharacterized OsmC-like protein
MCKKMEMEGIMKTSAHIQNRRDENLVFLTSDGNAQVLSIASKPTGYGSSINGRELLCLALATCFCNDLYREAAKRDIKIEMVEVEVESEFGAEGEPARALSYRVNVKADASEEEINQLIIETDHMAEIQNTIRKGLPIRMEHMYAQKISSESDRYGQINSNLNI